MRLPLLLLLLAAVAAFTYTLLANVHRYIPNSYGSPAFETSCAASAIVASRGVIASPKGMRFVKHSELVQGLASGQGMPGRLQCRGSEALFRTLMPTGTCLRSESESVSFVSMLVSSNQNKNCGNSILGNKGLDDKSSAVFRVFSESINMAMPASEIVVLSNSDYTLSGNSFFGRIKAQKIAGNYSRGNLMLQRLESYIAFLDQAIARRNYSASNDHKQHIIFADSDMIVVGDLGCVFEGHSAFDIALTFRNNKQQPINSALIFIRGTEKSLLKGKEFLEQVVKVYKEKFMKSAGMLGDQLAFAWTLLHSPLIQGQLFRKHEAFIAEFSGMQLLFLPCATYNWTPSEGAGQFHGMPIDVKVLHFKGSRKRLMLEAWKFHKSKSSFWSDFSDMKCLVLGSGRSKYDF